MLSSDENILVPGTEACERMQRYGSAFGRLTVIVAARRSTGAFESPSLCVYPAFGAGIVARVIALYRIGLQNAKKAHFDLVSAQGPDEIGLIGYFLSRRCHIRLQLQLHTDLFSPQYRRAGLKEQLRILLARFLLPRADCVRVVSRRIRDFLVARKLVDEKCITILPIFTDVSRFIAEPPDHALQLRFSKYEPRMIAIGRFMEKEKNFLLLIDTMREVVKTFPRSVLLIVGEGPDKKLYESKIRMYGLEKNVVLEPWRDDLPAVLKSFDILLVSSNYEGWGRVAVEAMAAGLPVVMTDVGLARELVRDGENGKVIAVGDPKGFVHAIEELAHNPQQRALLGRRAQETVTAELPQTFEEYVGIYKKMFEKCL